MRRLPLLLGVVGALLIADANAAAQRLGPVQKRPKLSAGADTNDASAYMALGAKSLENAPDEAAAAFLWAARLDPSSADALYARAIALAMRKPTTLANYLYPRNAKVRRGKDFVVIDSIYFRALRLDPLLYPRYYTVMQRSYLRNENRAAFGAYAGYELDQAIRDYLERRPHFIRGRVMFANGRLDQALIEFDDAIKQFADIPSLRMERGRVHGMKGDFPKALKDFNDAVGMMRTREEGKDDEVIFYDSKAIAEHSIGRLWAMSGNADSAKAAYGRATAEDLSFFPAHMALGMMALALKDTATAVSELSLAAETATDEPYVQLLHGSTLVAAGQPAEAIAPLNKAIELEPVYAEPHYWLGQALERTGDAAGAKASYERFLGLSARRDPARNVATQRLAALGGAGK
jgi:tetratricopeptide (TPR) repeat protein